MKSRPRACSAGITLCMPSCIAWAVTRNTTTKRTHPCWLRRKAPARSCLKKEVFAWLRPISLLTRKPDVERVAKIYLKSDQFAILVLGKEKDFEAPLTSLGKVTRIDITIP